MNREKTQKIAMGFILFFITIAIITQLITRPLATTGLCVIVGVIIFLYKFPPQWLINWTQQTKAQPTTSKGKKRKKYPFRVIDGKKKSS
jgi:hypothetical protein